MLSVFVLASESAVADVGRYVTGPVLAQASGDAVPGSAAQIQNIQRLLKLLADRYPTTYRSVDPGLVDGNYGAGTRDAIRNFRAISGNGPSPQGNEQLVADILSTLAQMAATQSAEAVADPSVTNTVPAAAAPEIAPKPKPQSVKAPSNPVAKPVQSAQPNEVPATPTTAGDGATSKPGTTGRKAPPLKELRVADNEARDSRKRVYFVQAASLRSLDSAKREWQRIFDENRAALRGEQVYFEQASIAGQGIYFRILIGPMAEQDAAKTLCAFLEQNDQTCLVTSRNLADLKKEEERSVKPDKMPSLRTTDDDKRGTEVGNTLPVADRSQPSAKEQPEKQGSTEAPPPQESAQLKPQAAPTSAGSDIPESEPTKEPLAAATKKAPGEKAEKKPEPAAKQVVVAPFTEKPGALVSEATTGATAGLEEKGVVAAATSTTAKDVTPPPRPTAATDPATSSPKGAPPTTATSSASGPADQGTSKPALSALPLAAVDRLLNAITWTKQTVGIPAVLLVGAALLLLIWRRHTRKSAFTRNFLPATFAFARPAVNAKEPLGALEELENDFDSESLKQSRSIRDEFLLDILGDQVNDDSVKPKEDSAIRINTSLKSLLVSDPAQYKSIFLNWLFLSKVGLALNQRRITPEQLNGHFGREFRLLQHYFKIHLLELDDRHRIRKQLPGLFYCLQLAQEQQRKATTRYSAA